MELTFQIGEHDNIVVTENYFANGIWLIERDSSLPEEFNKLSNIIINRRYLYGYTDPSQSEPFDESKLKSLFPEEITELDYYKMERTNEVVWHGDRIERVIYSFGPNRKIGFSPRFIKLFDLGDEILAKDARSAAVIMKNKNPIGLVMPMRGS